MPSHCVLKGGGAADLSETSLLGANSIHEGYTY